MISIYGELKVQFLISLSSLDTFDILSNLAKKGKVCNVGAYMSQTLFCGGGAVYFRRGVGLFVTGPSSGPPPSPTNIEREVHFCW